MVLEEEGIVLGCGRHGLQLCADLMRLLLSEHEVLVGEVNLAELRRVPTKRFKATAAHVDLIEQLLRGQTFMAKPAALLSLKVRDADDAWVLASAVDGGAELLVSGDQDLLVLASRAPFPILSPRDAWSRLRGEGDGVVQQVVHIRRNRAGQQSLRYSSPVSLSLNNA